MTEPSKQSHDNIEYAAMLNLRDVTQQGQLRVGSVVTVKDTQGNELTGTVIGFSIGDVWTSTRHLKRSASRKRGS
jgi:hypothetical protein